MTRRRIRSIGWFIAAATIFLVSIVIAIFILRDHPVRIFDHMPIRHNDIVLFGDSHIEYFDAAGMLNDRRIRNRGVAGENASDMLSRAPGITRGRPQKVILLAGANDAFQGREIEDYLRDMRSLIEKFRNNGGDLSVLSIPPTTNGQLQDRIDEFNKALVQLCEDRNVPFIDLDPVLKRNGLLDGTLTTDGVHLDRHGYERIVPLLRAALPRSDR